MSSRPCPWKASFSIVQGPMLRIRTRRCHAPSCSHRSTCPAATARDTRPAPGRGAAPDRRRTALPARAHQARRPSGRRAAPWPRRPQRQTIRRWMSSARSDSISCSVIAHASASNGSGRRCGRTHGVRRIIGPIRGSRLKARWNSPASGRRRTRSACARSPTRPPRGTPRRGSARRRAIGQARTTTGGPPASCSSRQKSLAPAQQAVAPGRREPVRAGGVTSRSATTARRSTFQHVYVDEERA